MSTRIALASIVPLCGCSHPGTHPDALDHMTVPAPVPQARCTVRRATDTLQHTRLCRVHSFTEWEGLALTATDATAGRVLAALAREIRRHEHRHNYWLSFVQKDRACGIRDAGGWLLDSVLTSDISKAGCSSVRDTDALLLRAQHGPEGDGEGEGNDPSDGKRCGNIAVVHSLLRLGVLTPEEAFEGEHIDKALVERIDRFHDAQGGMTADQQRRAYEDFNTPQRRIECTTAGLSGSVDDALNLQAASKLLRRLMASTQPVFDCSLAIYGDRQADGHAGFRHVEHVTGVRQTGNGEIEIDTLDGLKQGEGSAGVPKAPGTNTWGIGSNYIQFKTSTDQDNRRRYSEESFHAYDVRCCYLR